MVKNKKKAGDNTKIHILKKSDRIKFVQKKNDFEDFGSKFDSS